MCCSGSAGMRHVQNTYMYSVLGLPGFIDFDGNGTICFFFFLDSVVFNDTTP